MTFDDFTSLLLLHSPSRIDISRITQALMTLYKCILEFNDIVCDYSDVPTCHVHLRTLTEFVHDEAGYQSRERSLDHP